MRKVFLILLVLAWPLSAWAGVTYYVSNANPVGSDTNNGTSTSTPWLTIAKVNSSTFNPGDSILFNGGCVWRETLTPPSPGTSGSPITFGAYGTGAAPIISGSVLLRSNWSQYSGHVWQVVATTQPAGVYFNGARGTLVSGIASVTAQYDWYWASNVLYAWSPSGGDPSAYYTSPGVEAENRTNTIVINGTNYITFTGLELTHANISTRGGVYVHATGVTLDTLTVDNNDGFAGIYVQGSSDVIQNSTIYNTRHTTADRGSGIILDGGGGNYTVSGNTIYNNTASGINLAFSNPTSNNTISNNTIYQNGSAGISVNAGCSGNIIQSNLVYQNGQLNADYFQIDLYQVGNNNIVRYNETHGGHFISIDSGGIRFDGATGAGIGTGNIVYCNLIYNEYWGIHLLNISTSAAVYNNTIYNSTQYGIFLEGESDSGNIVKNNIIHTAGTYLIYKDMNTRSSTIDYNVYYPDGPSAFNYYGIASNFASWKSNSGQDAHAVQSNPLFVSTSTPDFRLQPGSPAIKAGTNVGLTIDYAGNPIPSVPDIGAYEFLATLAPPTDLQLVK